MFALRRGHQPNYIKYADSVYQGWQKLQKNVVIPHKKITKKPLTQEQKEHNRKLTSFRMRVENKIMEIKIFKIMSHVYRNFQKKYKWILIDSTFKLSNTKTSSTAFRRGIVLFGVMRQKLYQVLIGNCSPKNFQILFDRASIRAKIKIRPGRLYSRNKAGKSKRHHVFRSLL